MKRPIARRFVRPSSLARAVGSGCTVSLFGGVALCVASFCAAACGGEAFDESPGISEEDPNGAGGEMGNGSADDDGDDDGADDEPTRPRAFDVEARLDVDPETVLGDLSQAQRNTLCADILRVFNADVDNERYLEIHCTELAWEASSGEVAECGEAYQACLEQVPPPLLSDRIGDSLGCDAARESFFTPAGVVTLDSACATIGQTLACWRSFGVAYERGFMDSVASAPRTCADAAEDAPDLSAQVGFGIPGPCNQLADAVAGCD